jgi:hypothetical protein
MGQGVLTLGPWLKPSLDYCGWTSPTEQEGIVKQVLMSFNRIMAAFASSHKNVLHVNTQGTCQPNHWANELHLNSDGCFEVARVINAGILPVLTDRR